MSKIKKHFGFSLTKAFTIIEVLVVITIIAILTGVTALTTTKYEQNANDSERQSKSSIIASALEKYYDENFEYPSCALLTDTPANVKSNTLTDLTDVSTLKAPRAASGTNSIVCGTTVPPVTQDSFVYTCTSNVSCAKWDLKYRKESNGSVVSIPSQRAGNASANGGVALNMPTVSLTANLSGTDATGTASASCSVGTPEYQIHYYRNSGAFPPTWTDASTVTATGVTQGESATFQAQARCVQAGMDPSDYAQSSVETVSNPVIAPTGLSTTATISGSSAIGTVTGGTCTGGTVLKRQIRSLSQGQPWTAGWTSYADITGTTLTLAANEGWEYRFQQQAQCLNTTSGVGSTWTVDTDQGAVRPIATRGAPGLTTTGSLSNIHWDWGNLSCPVGTWAQYQWYRTGSWGGTFGWWGPITETYADWPDNSQGYTFSLQVQQRCQSGYTSGAWSASGSGSYARPVYAPGAPTGFSHDRQGLAGIAFSWNAPACGPGTTPDWQADWANQGGSGISWVNAPSGRASYWWFGGNSYDESAANPSTAWSNALPSYGYMGDRDNQYSVIPPRMELGADNEFDTDNYLKMAVEYRCRNPTSGAVGPVGPVNSYSYRWP